MTNRVKFNHDEENIVKALGFQTPEAITAAGDDEGNPDHLKIRLAALLLNSDVNLVVATWAHLLTGEPLTPVITKNFETLFAHYDNDMLKKLDAEVNLFNRNRVDLSDEDILKSLGLEVSDA